MNDIRVLIGQAPRTGGCISDKGTLGLEQEVQDDDLALVFRQSKCLVMSRRVKGKVLGVGGTCHVAQYRYRSNKRMSSHVLGHRCHLLFCLKWVKNRNHA